MKEAAGKNIGAIGAVQLLQHRAIAPVAASDCVAIASEAFNGNVDGIRNRRVLLEAQLGC